MAGLEINKLLEFMVESGGSDIYIAAGAPPRMNVEGSLQDLAPEPLSSEDAQQLIRQILTDEQWHNFFPREYHPQILVQLSYNLRAIICQRLIPTESGKRLPVLEILINTAFAQELIQKGELGQLKKVMESGKQEGMQTFDLHLKELVEKGVISEEKALIFADSPSILRLKLRGFV